MDEFCKRLGIGARRLGGGHRDAFVNNSCVDNAARGGFDSDCDDALAPGMRVHDDTLADLQALVSSGFGVEAPARTAPSAPVSYSPLTLPTKALV